MVARAERTVIIDPAFLGDVVFDAPLVRAIRAGAGDAVIGIVVRPAAEAIARRIPGIDRIHVFDKRGRDRGLGGLRRVGAALAAECYDRALIPHPSVRSALLAALAGIPARVGSSPGMLARLLLTEARRGRGDTFVGERLRLLGGSGTDALLAGALRATPEDRAGLGARAAPDGRDRAATGPGAVAGGATGGLGAPPVGIAGGPPCGSGGTVPDPATSSPPGAGAHQRRLRVGLALGSEWATKRWPVENAAAFVAALDLERCTVVGLGADWERPLFDALLRRAGARFAAAFEEPAGGSVDQLIAQIIRCDVVVAGDTGPLQIARGLGIPVVALFGPTPEGRHDFTPLDEVLTHPVPCRPCSPHGHRVCPEGHHRCMRELAPSRVAAAVAGVLARRGEVVP